MVPYVENERRLLNQEITKQQNKTVVSPGNENWTIHLSSIVIADKNYSSARFKRSSFNKYTWLSYNLNAERLFMFIGRLVKIIWCPNESELYITIVPDIMKYILNELYFRTLFNITLFRFEVPLFVSIKITAKKDIEIRSMIDCICNDIILQQKGYLIRRFLEC